MHDSIPDFAHYDDRNYRTLDIAEGYRRWSSIYDDEMDPRVDLELLGRSALVSGAVGGADIVDLACGTGRIGEFVVERGAASVCGVDLSKDMLALARRRDIYSSLHHADMCETPLDDGSFDGAVSSMALCHIRDLERFFAECARLLRDDGWLFFVDFHPFMLLKGIPTNFDDPETGEPLAIRVHVHPVSEYFHAAEPNFEVVELDEKFIDEPWVEEVPGLRNHLGWPVTLAMGFRLRP